MMDRASLNALKIMFIINRVHQQRNITHRDDLIEIVKRHSICVKLNHEVLYTFVRWVAQTFVPLISHIFVAFQTFTLKLLKFTPILMQSFKSC